MKKISLNSSFIVQRIGKKTTVFNAEDSLLYTFNGTGAFLFRGIQLGWDEKKLSNELSKAYKLDKKQALQDTKEFVADLLKKGVVSSSKLG